MYNHGTDCTLTTHDVGFAPVVTLVLWTSCVLVGTLGFTLPYARPQAPVPPPSPLTFQKITVELERSQLPSATVPTSSVSPLAAPPLAPSIGVASPAPSLAFALPIPGPVRVSTTSQATSSVPMATAVKTASVKTLVFGQGEGRQPAPPYPPTAIRQGQEGVVTVRLNVDSDGYVTAAEASAPSPWPLLNEAAIRTVLNRWHFTSGVPRSYEVIIRFTLQK